MSTASHLQGAEAQRTGEHCSEVGQAHSGVDKLSSNTFKSSPAMSKKGPLSCKWSTCHQQDIIFATPDDLAEHVHSNHIALFCDEEVVVCLWEGCKVYNKPSSSYTWLQRHMQQVHTKERPFKCIMNGCNLSFQSTDALQRHLERHLDPAPMPVSKTLAANVYPKPSPFVTVTQDNLLLPAKRQCLETESSASDSAAESKKWSHHLHSKGPGDTLKPRRRQSSLKVRIPRHSLLFAFSTPSVCGPAPLNGVHVHTEVLDHRTMSVIRHTAHQLAQFDIINGETSCIALKAMVLGRRKCCSRTEEEVLIRWVPTLVPDAWIPVSQYSDDRVVSLKELSPQQLSVLASNCFGYDKLQNRKCKRKPH